MWAMGVGMLVVGLIVGFIIGWFWQKNSSQLVVGDEIKNNSSSTQILAASIVPTLTTIYQQIDVPASVSVDDQKAGNLVFIKHSEVSKPTWIAVREIVGESLGNILGAGMVTSAADDVPVTLLRSTVTGQKYAVFLYQDNGDGEFNSKTDLLVMQNGAPVATTFVAQ